MPDRELSLSELRALMHESHSNQKVDFVAIFLEEKEKPSLYDMVLNQALASIATQREIIFQLYKAVNAVRLSVGLSPVEIKTPAMWKNELEAANRKLKDPRTWEEPTGSSD